LCKRSHSLSSNNHISPTDVVLSTCAWERCGIRRGTFCILIVRDMSSQNGFSHAYSLVYYLKFRVGLVVTVTDKILGYHLPKPNTSNWAICPVKRRPKKEYVIELHHYSTTPLLHHHPAISHCLLTTPSIIFYLIPIYNAS
jgi:hypothetical protein